METKESPGSIAIAYTELKALHAEFPHPVDDGQAVKEYPDGMQIVINSYKSAEYDGADSKIDTLSVNVSPRGGGLSFVATENGLVNFTVDRQAVSLRSILHPRAGENLRIKYNDPTEEAKPRKTLLAYREASSLLAQWIKNIDSSQQYTPPPVSIVEK